MNYKEQIQQMEQAEQAAAAQQRNDQVWRQIIDTYPIRDCEANRRMVEDYCGGTITMDKFSFLQQNPPRGYTLAWGEEWQKLLDEILSMLHDPFGRRMTEFDLKSAKMKMSFWTRAQLRARRDELALKQELNKKSVLELKADLRKAREVKRPFPGYPTMLSTIVPRYAVPELGWDTIHAVPTGDYVRYLSRHDLFLFKKFVCLYSGDQVTYWLNN
jgi:hypothetical protein